MTQEASANSPDVRIVKRLNRRRLFRAILLSCVIFVGGGVTGWGVGTLIRRPPPRLGPGMVPDPPIKEIVRHMQDELLLTDEQTQQMTTIYTKRYDALKAIRDGMLPKLNSEYDGLRSDVEKVLTAAQFKRWNERFEAARNRMLPPEGPPPRRPGPGRMAPDEPPPPFGGPGANRRGPDGLGPPPPGGPPRDEDGRGFPPPPPPP